MIALESLLQQYLSDKVLSESQLAVLASTDSWLAGGTISSLLCNREVKDLDIYFSDPLKAVDFINVSSVLSCSDKAVICAPIVPGGPLIQLVFDRMYGSAEKIFEAFDFTVCMGAYHFGSRELIVDDRFYLDNAARRLVFNKNTSYPIISALRIDKYKGYGYNISILERIKVYTTIASLKLETLDDLRAQIGGMYGQMITEGAVTTIGDFLDIAPLSLPPAPQSEENVLVQSFVDAGGGANANAITKIMSHILPGLEDILVKGVQDNWSDTGGLSGPWSSASAGTGTNGVAPILYVEGATLDTNKINGNKWIYGSPVVDHSHLLGDILIYMKREERYPLPDNAPYAFKAYAGIFEIGEALCTVKEWMKLSISERIQLLTDAGALPPGTAW